MAKVHAAGKHLLELINDEDHAERINYTGVERIIVNGSFGNDRDYMLALKGFWDKAGIEVRPWRASAGLALTTRASMA